jgi:hypothetical protein
MVPFTHDFSYISHKRTVTFGAISSPLHDSEEEGYIFGPIPSSLIIEIFVCNEP